MSWTPAKGGALFCAVLIALVALPNQNAEAANILGLFTSHSPSHLIVHMSVVKALAEKGHNVTVVSGLEPKVTHPSIRHIVIPPTPEQDRYFNNMLTEMAGKKNSAGAMMLNFFTQLGTMIDMQFDIFKDERFTALYESPDTKFDLVILGYFMNDFELGVAAKFKCPVIVEWTGQPMGMVGELVGNPAATAYVPSMHVVVKPGEAMGFMKRLQNLFSNVMMELIATALENRMEKYYTKLFPADGTFPTYDDMKRNVSLLFCNSHFSEGPIRPNVPAVVEIGGIQIKQQPDPLPKDIAEFLDASQKNGAILFSLGSNLKSDNIKPELIQIIFKVLSSLKQNVIWKWEDLSKTPGKSANILYKKWLPQDDILAHPNLKLFITHAGKGGLAEAQYHAVPMVALPVFADQNTNAASMADAGYGLQLELLQITEVEFKRTVTEVLSNPSYAKNVKRFSRLYRDRPLTAKESVVFWTEYVLRHHGAPHLQSPLVHMSGIASMNLDVIVLLCLVVYLSWRIAKLLFRFVYKKFFGKTCKNSASNKNKVKKQPKSSLPLFSVLLIAAFVTQQTPSTEAANILGLFTSHSPSHLIVHMSVAKALVEKGHNVTIVSTFEPKVTHPSIRTLVIPPTEAQEKAMAELMDEMAGQKNSIFSTMRKMFGSLGLMIDMQFDILKDKRFTALYESPDTKFDLVIMGYFMNDFLLGVAAKFKCPVIVNWSGPTMGKLGDMVGNPNEISYVPNLNQAMGERMNFMERAKNMFASVFMNTAFRLMDYRLSSYYYELFPRDNNFPTYLEMKKNISLVFCNGHFSEGPIRPFVPALVEIGGIQIKEQPDELPKDIADFLEASKKHGAVLFSLGSNLKGSNIKPEIVQTIYKVLSSLKQNVIWKWEDLEKTPGKAANILYKKWLPQDDILAHPNLKLFITHAGKGGLTEAQYHGVPMVALPVFGDQNSNAEVMATSGHGLQLDLLQLNEAEFKHAVTEVLSNPAYAKSIKEFSNLYRDRPLTAKQTVVFWTEYVLRHHGAPHMQSPLIHMNGIASNNLDVFAVLALGIYLVWSLFKFAYHKLCARFCTNCKASGASKKSASQKKVKKQ